MRRVFRSFHRVSIACTSAPRARQKMPKGKVRKSMEKFDGGKGKVFGKTTLPKIFE